MITRADNNLNVKLLDNAVVRSAKIFTEIYCKLYVRMHKMNSKTKLLLEARFYPLILAGLMNMVTNYGPIVPIDYQVLKNCPCITALMRANFFDAGLTTEVFMKKWKDSMFFNEDAVEVALTEKMYDLFQSSVYESLANYEWTNIPMMMTIVAHMLIHSHIDENQPIIKLKKTKNIQVGGTAENSIYKEDVLFLTPCGNIRREVLRKNVSGSELEKAKAMINRANQQVAYLCQDAKPVFIIPTKRDDDDDDDGEEDASEKGELLINLEDFPMLFIPSSNKGFLNIERLLDVEKLVSKMSFHRHIFSLWSRDQYLQGMFNDGVENYYQNGPSKYKEEMLQKLQNVDVGKKPKGKGGRKRKRKSKEEADDEEDEDGGDDGGGGGGGDGGGKIKLSVDEAQGYTHEELQAASKPDLARYAKTLHNRYKIIKDKNSKMKNKIEKLKADAVEEGKKMKKLEKDVDTWKKKGPTRHQRHNG